MKTFLKKTAKKKGAVKNKIILKKSANKLPSKPAAKTKLSGQLASAIKICDSAFKKMVSTQQAFIKAEHDYVKAKAKVAALQEKITAKAAKE